MRFCLLIALLTLSGCATLPSEQPAVAASCSSYWQLLYRHDVDGKPLHGEKTSLFAAVRSGVPIRFAWGGKFEVNGQTLSVEHVAEPVFLTIAGGQEVVVQLPEHILQKSYAEISGAEFNDPAILWRGLMSTNGTFDAVMVHRSTGKEIRRLPQRVSLAWFAFLPPSGCPTSQPLELAVPGGVIHREH